MTAKQKAALKAAEQAKPERFEAKTIEPRVQSVARLEQGEHPFTMVGYGVWNVPDRTNPQRTNAIDYISLETDKGPKGLSLGSLYFATLTSAGVTVGEAIADNNNEIHPIVGLSGTLIVTKDGDNLSLELSDVELDELIDA